MPLLVITGYPSSGKSTIVERICSFFREKNYTHIEVISDDGCAEFSRTLYEEPRDEREHRNSLRSKVQRQLSRDRLVVCDSLNYMKGFRYELFCIAKLVKTTYAVVFCNATEDTCLWLDSQKSPAQRYGERLIKELRMRYEFPEQKNRWDSPLFELSIGMEEGVQEGGSTELGDNPKQVSPRFLSVPLIDVYLSLVEGKELPVNLSTLNTPLISNDFVQSLEQVTKEVTSSLFQQQNGAVLGDTFAVPFCPGDCGKVIFKRQRTLPELARLRRQFIAYAKKHPVQDKSKIASLFVDFLNSTL